ncbi:hypothetical protein NC651_025016 [Populus alba x Populus x berolinensis]|nr:hypothetical protein NC651_025016 [Populus alba x Populus x berolinensis]
MCTSIPNRVFFLFVNSTLCGYLVLSIQLSTFIDLCHLWYGNARTSHCWASAAAVIVTLAHKGNANANANWLAVCVAFVAFMLIVIRPAMKWIARRCSPEHDTVDGAYICLTLAGVMVPGFMTDLIAIHAIFGAFVFGLTIPEGEFADQRLMERIEDFVSACAGKIIGTFVVAQ